MKYTDVIVCYLVAFIDIFDRFLHIRAPNLELAVRGRNLLRKKKSL